MWLSTSTGMAMPLIGIALAKYSGRPGTISSGWRIYGTMRLGRLLGAGADARKRQRGAHQLQEVAAPFRIVPLGRLLGKLAMQVLAELRRVGQLAEAAPVQASVRAGEAGFEWQQSPYVLTASSFQFPASSCRLDRAASVSSSTESLRELRAPLTLEAGSPIYR